MCDKNYESWLAVDKVIATKWQYASFSGPPCMCRILWNINSGEVSSS